MNISRAVLVAAIPLLAASGARAQFQNIVGDALTVTATANGRTATLAIPHASLVQLPNAEEWHWLSPAATNLVATDGTVLGSFSGEVLYDTLYDNIYCDFNFFAGAADTRFAVRSSDLTNSFTSGFSEFDNFGRLIDTNADGATLTGQFSTRCIQLQWNGVQAGTALPGFSVGPGGNLLHTDNQLVSGSYVGTEVLRMDFTLSAMDTLNSRAYSIVAIPAPPNALLALPLLALAHRRRP